MADAYEDGDFGDLVADEVDKQKIREGKIKELRQMDHLVSTKQCQKNKRWAKVLLKEVGWSHPKARLGDADGSVKSSGHLIQAERGCLLQRLLPTRSG